MYAWRGRNVRGEAVQGQMEAQTEGGVADQLMSIGVAPVQIAAAVLAVTSPAAGWLTQFKQKAISVEDILVFSRQMYTLNKAGIPIFRAFSGLEASATKPAMIAMLRDIRSSLDQGRDLSAAMARHPKVFSPFYLSMVQIGELTGRLSEVFLHLYDHLEFERDVRERVKSAMRYPMFVMIAMAIAVVILTVFVIPVFAKVFDSFHAQLPLLTRGLLAFSGWMVAWWPLLVLGSMVVSLLVRSYLRTTAGRYRWDAFKLRLPVVGDIILKGSLARFARSFALASQSSVPLVQALTVVALTVDNVFIGSRIKQMRDGIENGGGISRCAAGTGVFTPLVLQMMAVGEETGEFDSLMFEIARMYEQQTDYSIKGLAAAIEPILLVVIAGLVLLLALGVFLPLWSLGQAASGRAG
jgi:MSHA biogenesis protein MshG